MSIFIFFFGGGASSGEPTAKTVMYKNGVVLVKDYIMHIFEALRASARGLRTKMYGMRPGRGPFAQRPRVGEVQAPQKRLRF